MHHWRLQLSTVMIAVAGLGILLCLIFLERGAINAWLAAHVFFFLALIIRLIGK